MPRNSLLAFFLGVSLFGLGITIMLALYPPPVSGDFPFRKPLMGFIFGSICALGMLAVLFPGPCSRTIGFKKEEEQAPPHVFYRDSNPEGKKLTLRGHHPDCGKFSAHVFRTDDKTFCAGCTGLFLGGLAAFTGAILYFFNNLHVGQNSLLLFWIGAAGVILGLFQFSPFSVSWRLIRSFINAFFAFGAFLVLVGIDEITQNIFIDLFLIVLIIFWLFTRMMFSQWDHERICRRCDVKACEFREL